VNGGLGRRPVSVGGQEAWPPAPQCHRPTRLSAADLHFLAVQLQRRPCPHGSSRNSTRARQSRESGSGAR
jgi:hypothetical protein